MCVFEWFWLVELRGIVLGGETGELFLLLLLLLLRGSPSLPPPDSTIQIPLSVLCPLPTLSLLLSLPRLSVSARLPLAQRRE